jgi:hypothetical protein
VAFKTSAFDANGLTDAEPRRIRKSNDSTTFAGFDALHNRIFELGGLIAG